MNIDVRVSPQHPTGERTRGGHAFGYQWSTVEVTKEQAAEIKADPYLQTRKPKTADAVVKAVTGAK